MRYIPKFVKRRMIPLKGVSISENNVVLTFMTPVFDMKSIDLTPMRIEVTIDREEINPEEMIFENTHDEIIYAGGEVKYTFPNTYNLKKGETHKITFEYYTGESVLIEVERTVY